MLPTLLLLGVAVAAADPPTHSGRDRELDVRPPRVETTIDVDGVLSEPVWRDAALLTGFSQYAPSDGLAAADSTQVLVWYSPTAIHFGIRAFARPGTVRATLTERDKIYTDDYVGVLLGTFHDGRTATVFAVNPLGVQGDGVMAEGSRDVQSQGREPADISPDFVFDSKGRLTEWGFEVELRIPFKSLRYQASEPQTWGLAVIRRKQSTGYEDSWTPARRAASSFLAQSGRLVGLTGMHRGLVLDVNPTLTERVDGAPPAEGGWRYDASRPALGGSARWGMTPNLTLSGTANPDFSQIEADAGQLAFDPRDAIYLPERRPFFLEGIEQFQTPLPLVYTRRIVQPGAAAKLTGTIGATNVGVLAARDRAAYSFSREDHPVFVVGRAQQSFGARARVGALVTSRSEGPYANQVAAVDARALFARIWAVQLQGGTSWTRTTERERFAAPLWRAELTRNGRRFGMRALAYGVDRDFRAGTGFVTRPGVAQLVLQPRLSFYGAPGGWLDQWQVAGHVERVWQYAALEHGAGWQDQRTQLSNHVYFRGWHVGLGLMAESYGYDPTLYAGTLVERDGELVPFTGSPRIFNRGVELSFDTPRYRTFSGFGSVTVGRDANFFEWAPADIVFSDLGVRLRPNDRLRIDASYALQWYARRGDGSVVFRRQIPRLRTEYQLSRPLSVRVITEYDAARQDDLRDDGRTGGRLFRAGAAGAPATPLLGYARNRIRADGLVSYQPNPGTVVFAGYTSTLAETDAFRFRDAARQTDGWFAKVSYLYRL